MTASKSPADGAAAVASGKRGLRIGAINYHIEVKAALSLTVDGLAFRVTVSGLTGAITNAHFHEAPLGDGGGVVRGIMEDFEGNTASGIWTAADAQPLTDHMAHDRRLIAPDYRGRGRSDHAPDWSSYTVEVELADAIALLDRLGIDRVVLIGTSRGGLIAMALAVLYRDRLAGVLLNDIGPVLEPAGLLRIRRYLGKPLRFTTWRGAVAALKRDNPGFESLSEAEWLAFAHRLYRDEGGRPVLDYDPDLRRSFPTAARIVAGAVPPMWELMAALEGLPVAALRGEHSDLLSPETHARMGEMVPGLDAVTVANCGHAPFLDEPESVPPKAHIHTESKLAWVNLADGLADLLVIEIDHPGYQHRTPCSEATRASLATRAQVLRKRCHSGRSTATATRYPGSRTSCTTRRGRRGSPRGRRRPARDGLGSRGRGGRAPS